jgi:hypothetical protein
LATIGFAMLLAALPATARAAEGERRFVHHVFFWLKDPASTPDRDRLIAGLRKLAKVETIRRHQIGTPAATRRDVVDHTYAVSWLIEFADKGAHDRYQVDPVHLKFVEECSGLWQRVQVYDTDVID